jgi:hypothetical protein
LRQSLGIDVGTAEPFPEKPKGMWVSTYARLLEETLQADILANEGRTDRIQRFVAQI